MAILVDVRLAILAVAVVDPVVLSFKRFGDGAEPGISDSSNSTSLFRFRFGAAGLSSFSGAGVTLAFLPPGALFVTFATLPSAFCLPIAFLLTLAPLALPFVTTAPGISLTSPPRVVFTFPILSANCSTSNSPASLSSSHSLPRCSAGVLGGTIGRVSEYGTS